MRWQWTFNDCQVLGVFIWPLGTKYFERAAVEPRSSCSTSDRSYHHAMPLWATLPCDKNRSHLGLVRVWDQLRLVRLRGHWWSSALIQAVGRCCLDGYGAQGVVWSNPDTRKATARYVCIRPTTQSHYLGAGKPEKRGHKSCLPSEVTNLACGMQSGRFDS